MADSEEDVGAEDYLDGFRDFVRISNLIFQVHLSFEQAVECETVGELENLIYDQVQCGGLSQSDRLRLEEDAIERMNEMMPEKYSDVTTSDFDKSLNEFLVDTQMSWRQGYWMFHVFFGANVPPIGSAADWAKRLVWLGWFTALAIGIWLAVRNSVCLGLSIFLICSAILIAAMCKLPKKKPASSIMMRDIMDAHIDGIEKCQKELSFAEVQYRVRRLYSKRKHIDPVTAETIIDFS